MFKQWTGKMAQEFGNPDGETCMLLNANYCKIAKQLLFSWK